METITLVPVTTPTQIETVAELAEKIWSEHYAELLGPAQICYMVEKFQSAPAVRSQLEHDGYQYFLFQYGGANAGYLAIQFREDSLFLSKIYVEKEFRRKRLAKTGVEYAKKICLDKGFQKLWLTVNKGNSGSIAAYEKMGFRITREQTADIGGGFVMDDYIMELSL